MPLMTAALILENDDRVEAAADAIISAGRLASSRHWVPATSGNFSVRVDRQRVAITRSGVDKGALTRSDILIQDVNRPLLSGSSAEAALHVSLYADAPDINAVFHTHGLASTVIGRAHVEVGSVEIQGWELQKALSGLTTHEQRVVVPVFGNDQNIAALSERISDHLARPVGPETVRAPGYLLAGHGLYVWGHSAAEASRHLEALETLFGQILALRSYKP